MRLGNNLECGIHLLQKKSGLDIQKKKFLLSHLSGFFVDLHVYTTLVTSWCLTRLFKMILSFQKLQKSIFFLL